LPSRSLAFWKISRSKLNFRFYPMLARSAPWRKTKS
jgi:hypothetical protein